MSRKSTNKTSEDINKSSSSEKLSSQFDSLNIKARESSEGVLKRKRAEETKDTAQKKISRSSSVSFHRRSESSPSERSGADDVQTVLSKKDRIDELPTPPSFGKLGRETELKVNCFRVHCKTESISLYSVTFDPELPDDSAIYKQSLIFRHIAQIRQIFGVFIFDNTRIWSLNQIKEDVDIPDDQNSIRIRFTKSVLLKDAPYDEFSQIIHIIFQKATKRSNLVKIGRNYYDKNTLRDERFLLRNDNIRLFRGYSMSIEQTQNGLHLTVDISHRVISVASVAGLIDSFDKNLTPDQGQTTRRDHRGNYRGSLSRDSYGNSSGNDDRVRNNDDAIMKRAEEEIIGRCVITTYRMRNWRIDEIDWSQNIDSKFTWKKKSGETVSISYRDYFLENYRLKLVNTRYGMLVNLPKVKNTKQKRVKGPDRFVLPPEACYMTGMSMKMKSDFRLMKRVRDVASLTPPQRFQSICDIVNQVSTSFESSSSDDKSECSEDSREKMLQIHVEPRALHLKGRILNDVNVRIKTDGNMMNAKAKDLMRHWQRAQYVNQNPHTVARWIVFHERRYNQQANMLVNELMKTSGRYRMLKTPLDVIEIDVDPRSRLVFNRWKDEIEHILQRVKGLQLIVVLLPSHFKSDDVYSAVKSATLMDGKMLVPTQCIKAARFEQRAQRSLRSVIGSTLKQILTKRGNIPWIVNYDVRGSFNPFDKKTMLCGIDVNHDVKRNRSTAGICVSGDSRFSRYDTYVSIGPSGRENIDGAEKCMVKSLIAFHNDNGCLPEHVVVYRDGVSNSELTKIFETEVKSFRSSFRHREVLKRSNGTYSPKLTFVVVQKNVSLRIFNRNTQSAEPGTVVDSSIVSSRFWDFYMLTTKPPPGKTSRPTRYIVVYDDYGISNDDLQAFTNQLCHTYYNFPGPIRVPAPVQIAHQVAYLYGSIIAETKEQALFTPKCKGKAYYL